MGGRSACVSLRGEVVATKPAMAQAVVPISVYSEFGIICSHSWQGSPRDRARTIRAQMSLVEHVDIFVQCAVAELAMVHPKVRIFVARLRRDRFDMGTRSRQ